MNIKWSFLPVWFLLLLSCWLSREAVAAPNVTIAPLSDNAYGVQGIGVAAASGMDIIIRYDSTALTAPQVAQGGLVSGALMAVNVSVPGTIRLALVRVTPISGSGTIATVTFARLKSTGTDILALISSIIDSSGRNIPVTSQVVNPVKAADSGDIASTDQNTGQSTSRSLLSTATGTSVTATTPVGIMAIVPPAAGEVSSEVRSTPSSTGQPVSELQQQATDTFVLSGTTESSSKEKLIAKAVEPEKKKINMYQGVLERFREFKGTKTPNALMALFAMGEAATKQDPPIVLSNGKDTVKILLELDSKGKNNNFLLDGVSLVSLKNKEKDVWVLELLPDQKTCEATVSVPRDNQLFIIPLTVAPPLDVASGDFAKGLSEADFNRYLREKGTVKAPRFDLNRDGRRDYIDDFIFTANYLVQRDRSAKQQKNVVTRPSKN